jgi:hypothetical protein
MAYIVVVHMTANQPSLLPELLQKMMSIPVFDAKRTFFKDSLVERFK